MRYRDAVAEARRLVRQSEVDQWRLAELTHEQIEAGKTRAQWAKDIGVAASHVGRLYKIWVRWGLQPTAERPPFNEAYRMISERVDDPTEAQARKDERSAVANIRKATPKRKAEIAAELLTEPEVADEVVKRPTARRQIDRAVAETHQRELGLPPKGMVEPGPADAAFEASNLATNLANHRRIYEQLRKRFADDSRALVQIAKKIEPTVTELNRLVQGDLLLAEEEVSR
jgi:hypothetical protein